MDIFWVNSAGQLLHTAYSGAWQGVDNFGGRELGPVAAVSWGPYRIDVFGRGLGNSLQHIYYAPVPITGLSVGDPGLTTVDLNVSTSANYSGAEIRRTTGDTPPASSTDGTLVADLDAATTSVQDTGLTPDGVYSYAAFVHVNGVTSTVASAVISTYTLSS